MQRQSLLVAVVATVALLSFSVGAASIDTATGSDQAEMSPDDSEINNPDGQGLDNPEGGIDPPESESGARALLPSVPAPAVGALVGAVAVGLFVLWRLAGQSQTVDETSGETPTVAATNATKSTSHSASDIEVPLTNDVYRAWASLEDRIIPEDSASTPRDVEATATAAGADPDAVASLRTLFERVRYGRERPDTDIETRAREALETVTDGVDDIATGPDGGATSPAQETDEPADTPTGTGDG
ncbi:MAG: DUF4129 domain-containing protein [Haloarcula sp.]